MDFTLSQTLQAGTDKVEQSQVISAEAKQVLNETVTDGTTDEEILIAIDVSQLKCLMLLATQALTIKTT